MSAEAAIETLREATRGTEYEGRLFLVGGVLRDRALGLPAPEDVDLVLEGDAVALAEFLAARGLSDHHPVLYPRFGTAKIAVDGHDVEIVTARAESYESYSRKPSVVAASLKDDAYRRDFTINTLVENLHTGEALDLTGRAWEDLRAGIIRTPLDPHVTFYDDPLRMLRAVRFACRFGFAIAEETWAAITQMAGRLNLMGPEPPVVSAERIRDEFVKVVMTSAAPPAPNNGGASAVAGASANTQYPIPNTSVPNTERRMPNMEGLELLRSSGLLAQFFPELLEMVGVTQNAWHLYDVWTHTLRAVQCLPGDAPLTTRLAMLLHDVGKPRTRSEDARGVHFYEHQFVGAEMARAALNRLKFTNDEVRDVVALVELHMRLGEYGPAWSDAAVKRLIRAVHPYADALFNISRCDMAAMRQDVPHADLDALRARMEELNRLSDVAHIVSPLDGRDIMALLDVGPGPLLKEAKEFLVNEVLDGRLAEGDREAAADALKLWYVARGKGER